MPARSAALVYSQLGVPESHALLSDKLALCQHLSSLGIRVPRVHALGQDGTPICLEGLRSAGAVSGLFVKPRRGSGGRHSFAITCSGEDWLIDGVPVGADRLLARLDDLNQRQEMMLQDRLLTAECLADLSYQDRPPVLRITTTRAPDGPPTLHSALLIIARPEENLQNFLSGQLYAPIDAAHGTMKGGLLLESPDELMDCLEPCGPRLAGRTVPFFAAAVDAALRAMAAVGPVPSIHWDIVLTPEGPVFLEGNSAGNWIVATLPARYGLQAGSLARTLEQWISISRQTKSQSAVSTLQKLSGRAGFSAGQIILTLEAISCLVAARLLLLIIPFRKIARHLGDLVEPGDLRAVTDCALTRPDSARIASDIGQKVSAVARWMPFRAVCLQQALAAHIMLRRRQIASVLHMGSGRDDAGKLIAHAWLDAAGVPVTGYPRTPHISEIGCFVARQATSADLVTGHGRWAGYEDHREDHRLPGEVGDARLVAATYAFVVASGIAAIDPLRRAEPASLAHRQLDPSLLLRLARNHRILPMVERAVIESGLPLPNEVGRALTAEARIARVSSLANTGEEVRLAATANAAGLDAIFIKGATLAHLFYTDPSLKSSWDIDILIARADIRRWCELMRELGFVMDNPWGHDPGPRLEAWVDIVRETTWHHPQRGTAVELHVGLSDTTALLGNVDLASPRQTTLIGDVAVPTLADEQLFAYLCVHGTCHGWARLKWLIDVAAMIVKSRPNPSEWRAIAMQNGAGRCGDVTLLLCHEVLGIEVPLPLISIMKRDARTRSIVRFCLSEIDRLGMTGAQVGPQTIPEILAYMRNLLRCGIGPATVAQTAWAFWNRPIGGGMIWLPRALRPLAMLAWVPWRLVRRISIKLLRLGHGIRRLARFAAICQFSGICI